VRPPAAVRANQERDHRCRVSRDAVRAGAAGWKEPRARKVASGSAGCLAVPLSWGLDFAC